LFHVTVQFSQRCKETYNLIDQVLGNRKDKQNNPGTSVITFIKKNPTRCNNVSTFYYSIFKWSSTCFRRHIAHHQEPKTALAASDFFMRGRNLPRMKNQKLPVQF